MQDQTENRAAVSAEEAQSPEIRRAERQKHRVFLCMVFAFVLAGVSAIFFLMNIWMPSEYRKQAVRTYAPVLRSAKEGGILCFGAYEQDNVAENGKEPIEWIVLERRSDRVLLISRFALDCIQFNESDTLATWDQSTLLTWLNNAFFTEAFNGAEKLLVLPTGLETDSNPFFDTDPGEVTTERVFILNIEQANRYFLTDLSRQCKATTYAAAKGVRMDSETQNCIWWLRSPGYDASTATRVLIDGRINFCGYRVFSGHGVRPCVWASYDPDTPS